MKTFDRWKRVSLVLVACATVSALATTPARAQEPQPPSSPSRINPDLVIDPAAQIAVPSASRIAPAQWPLLNIGDFAPIGEAHVLVSNRTMEHATTPFADPIVGWSEARYSSLLIIAGNDADGNKHGVLVVRRPVKIT